MMERAWVKVLAVVIPLLLLADGTIHLVLNFVLFGGRGGGARPPGPPPGGVPPGARPPGPGFNPLILPLNQLFVLNFVGAIVLVLLFLLVLWRFRSKVWIVDIAMIVYAAAAFGAWLISGQPNPMGLGYLSKGIEIVLILSLLTHIWTRLRRPSPSPVSGPGPETPSLVAGAETAGHMS
jgi:hypothetical protein